ncbi:MAG: fumarate hydratase C-terminal domain-containing protein [Victivallales bacterium]|nr:fumarate hydratase C-terminal domain-containing protein [Victivallales bacterium]
MKRLQLPLTEESLRTLRIGDSVTLTGTIYTARDAAHKYLAEANGLAGLPDIRGTVLYHCGPVIIKENGLWKVTAAGPTTSIREEPYMPTIIQRYAIRGIIGKGGMGQATAAACRDYGCVYLHTIGGAAQVLASCIKSVPSVSKLEEFGAPEAIWRFEVEDFPAIVTMDSTGASLHKEVLESSQKRFLELLEK